MKTKGSRNKNGVKRLLSIHGYIEIFNPNHPVAKRNGYCLEHRMIAWDNGLLNKLHLEVHHINGIKTDNRIENLSVMTKEDHTSLTWNGKKRKPWTKEMRDSKSIQMKGNKNASKKI